MLRSCITLLRSAVLATALVCAGLPIAVSAAPSGPSITGLHVVGNQLVNSSNQVVFLHGVDRSGSEYMCLNGGSVFDGPSDQNSVNSMKAWGINVVRVPLNEDCWLGINGKPAGMSATQYRTAIANFVTLLNNNGMAVILDLQWAAPGATVANQLTPMPDADHAPAFWQSVAQTFGSNGSVIFDLFNEPYPDNNSDSTAAWTCLLQGGTCPGVGYQAAGTQSLVNAIRATGATNIIQVPGVQYTNVLSQWSTYKPTDPLNNLIADWHSYSDQICNNSACWNTMVLPVMSSVPLVVGEMGEHDCQATYINPLMAFLDAHGGSYLGWAWDTYDCAGFPALITDYNGTPTGFGAGLKSHFLSSSPAPSAPAPTDGAPAPTGGAPAPAGGAPAPTGGTAPAAPTATAPLDEVDLGGGSIDPNVAAVGDQVNLRQDTIGNADGTVLVKFELLDANNSTVLEADVPNQQLLLGSVLSTTAVVTVPDGLPPGSYALQASVYSPDGATLYGTNPRLGTLTILPGSSPDGA